MHYTISTKYVRTYVGYGNNCYFFVRMFYFPRISIAYTTALKKEHAGMASASAILDTLGRTAGVPNMMWCDAALAYVRTYVRT